MADLSRGAVSPPSQRAREAFWELAIDSLTPQLRGYIAKSRCSVGESDEIISDVFADIVALEGAFVVCADQWEFVLPIVRDGCANAQRRWRRELPASAWASAALQRLPPKQRDALQQHVLEDRSYFDVATTMHSSQAAARFNVHAALRRLHEAVTDDPPPGRGF